MVRNNQPYTLYQDVSSTAVRWLWYPYIAIGKITIVQGDPGDGKSTMLMNLIARLSVGGVLPDGTQIQKPQRVVYQCSEDNVGDTIKPRLEKAGADCKNIAFIDEDMLGSIAIDDERIRETVIAFRPSIMVIDPIQSYIENPADLFLTGKIRKILRKVGLWASTYECAIVLVSHLNKNEGTKSLYRNLGSIDLVATARSVLQIDRDSENTNHRIVRQIKNNLGPIGKEIHFEITAEQGFHWLDENIKAITCSRWGDNPVLEYPKTKQEMAAVVLKRLLSNGPVESTEVQRVLEQYGIGNKTMQNVKQLLGIKSYRKMRKWYWVMPDHMEHG